MMTIDAMNQDDGFRSLSNCRDIATQNISAMCAPSSSYAASLYDFVTTYGGGDGAPHVELMDMVAKGFGCNVSLGHKFWEGLAKIAFTDKTNWHPLVRLALAIANLTSDKIEDNVARLLSTADISKVASKALAAQALQAEKLLGEVLEIATALGGYADIIKSVGKVFTRVGLLLTAKEKQGRERVVFTFANLQSVFLADVSAELGRTVEYGKWSTKEPPSAASKPALAVEPQAAATLHDHADPVWIAAQQGFSLGSLIVEKGIDMLPERLYTIFVIDAEAITLQQVISYSSTPGKVQISLAQLLKDWSIVRSEPPVAMSQAPVGMSELIEVELHKLEALKAIWGVYEKHCKKTASCLAFFRRPDEVRSTLPFKKGELILAPVCSITHINSKNAANGLGVSLGKQEGKPDLWALPVAKPGITKEAPSAWPKNTFLSSFWWLTRVDNKKDANMELSIISQNGFMIPVFKNNCAIEAHQKLTYWLKKMARPESLQNVLKKSEAVEADVVAPKKRPRKA